MILLLQYLSPKGPVLFETYPTGKISKTVSDAIGNLMTQYQKDGIYNELVVVDTMRFYCAMFDLSSSWNANGVEKLMLIAYLEHKEKPTGLADVFQVVISKIQEEPDLYKGLYSDSKKKDLAIQVMEKKIREIFTENSKVLVPNRNLFQITNGQIIILGLQAVGKTCIINQLVSGDFSTKVRPTLAPNIIKLVFERMNLQIYDMAGQVKLRKNWESTCTQPNGIVFVLDSASTPELKEESVAEFTRMMRFYFQDPKRKPLPPKTPVLIIANKCDLKVKCDEAIIKKMYKPENFKIHFRIGLTSALTGFGIDENFKWLIDNLKE